MKWPSINFSFLAHDRWTYMELEKAAIITRSSLYGASALAALIGLHFFLQKKTPIAIGLGGTSVICFLSARYAPLPIAQSIGIIGLVALIAVPLAGMAYETLLA